MDTLCGIQYWYWSIGIPYNWYIVLAQRCPIPDIANGSIDCIDTEAEFEEDCSVSCEEGFTSDLDTVRCEASGLLEPMPQCRGLKTNHYPDFTYIYQNIKYGIHTSIGHKTRFQYLNGWSQQCILLMVWEIKYTN